MISVKKISCVIVHADPDTREQLEYDISKVSFLVLKGNFEDSGEALAFLRVVKTDIVFTDINTRGPLGIRLAESLPKYQHFVFVSPNTEYALTSFRFNTIDYLVQPFSLQRFLMTAEKIRLNNPPENCNCDDSSHMMVKTNGQIMRINYDDILYIKGQREYVGIQLRDKRVLVYKRMKEMENTLPENFKRVHVSFIVNTHHLSSVVSNHIITAGESIPIGNSYRHVIHRYLNAQVI